MKRPRLSGATSSARSDGPEPPADNAAIPASAEAPGAPQAVTTPPPLEGRLFPIVGIGASAGGLAAFEGFFAGMPEGWAPNMAFVLVQHLAPEHPSLLRELVSRYTSLPVREIEDGVVVQPNSVYVLAPGRDVELRGGALVLSERSDDHARPVAVDHFFQSLARDRASSAVGIVLSGNGSDGTMGLAAISAAGGMTVAQAPETASFDGMPTSAIAAGVVDLQLAPKDMLTELRRRQAGAQFGAARSERVATNDAPFGGDDGSLKKLFSLIQARTGHDFSKYKAGTVHRRIERRMGAHRIQALADYLAFVLRTPEELEALFQDFLIGVTQFFRDPEVFQHLSEKVLPQIVAGKPEGSVIRIWVAGCSTGEEAYSIAILVSEHLDTLQVHYTAQIFATDIDPLALATARAGLYPLSIARDMEPGRLARAFVLEPDGKAYRIRKRIRDLLIFSAQDVIQDPPFSHLDLVSCRNLLIYFGPELQKKVIRVFHYGLTPGGVLVLGTSEGVGDGETLFRASDSKLKIFERLPRPDGGERNPRRVLQASHAAPGPRAQPARLAEPNTVVPTGGRLRELTERALLHEWAPSAALVNARGELLYLHGRTGLFLEPAPGEAGPSNILNMAREGLKDELTVALHQCAITQQVTRRSGLSVRSNGHFTMTNLTVCPIPGATEPRDPAKADLFLVVLEDATARAVTPSAEAALPAASPGAIPELDADVQLKAAREELRLKELLFQGVREQLESSGEELRAANEEMQSVNEELQSTNEELETSKEELQSVNEELATVNLELQAKLRDLSRANNDMNNLLAGTGIGTVFVDHSLRVLRFTPAVSAIINLIPSDLGRPVAHIASNLVGYSRLVEDTQAVLDTLVPREFEVETAAGRWYSARIQPYRTLENVIEGAVISFIDITETVRARIELARLSQLSRLAAVARDSLDALTVQSVTGATLAWNPGAVRLYGWSEAEGLLLQLRDRMRPGLWQEELGTLRQLAREQSMRVHYSQRLDKSGTLRDVQMLVTALVDSDGCLYGLATTERLAGATSGPAQEARP